MGVVRVGYGWHVMVLAKLICVHITARGYHVFYVLLCSSIEPRTSLAVLGWVWAAGGAGPVARHAPAAACRSQTLTGQTARRLQ